MAEVIKGPRTELSPHAPLLRMTLSRALVQAGRELLDQGLQLGHQRAEIGRLGRVALLQHDLHALLPLHLVRDFVCLSLCTSTSLTIDGFLVEQE